MFATCRTRTTSVKDHFGLSVILAVCVRPRAKHAQIYVKFLPKVGLGPVSSWFHFGGDPDWPSLLFRGHSRPARSFRHKNSTAVQKR